MKERIISTLLVVAIILSLSTVCASEKTSYDQQLKETILKMKNLFGIDSSYDKFNSSVFDTEQGVKFNLEWSNSKTAKYISVSVDEKGRVTRYSRNEDSGENNEIKISFEQAKTRAIDYIKKATLLKDGEFRFVDEIKTPQYGAYSFTFEKLVDGIPLRDKGNLNISTFDGKLNSLNARFIDVKFPNAKAVISKEEAKEIFLNELGIERMVREFYDYKEDKTFFKTFYAEKYNNFYIDANTKELVKSNYYMRTTNAKEEAKMDTDLTPVENVAISKLKGMISQEEAIKIAKDTFPLTSGLIFKEAQFYQNSRGLKDDYGVWNLYFADANNESSATYQIDAISKNVVNYSLYVKPTEKKNPISYDKAKTIADELVKKLEPNKLYAFKLDKHNKMLNDSEFRYSFKYNRILKDTLVKDDEINISIDRFSGKVIRYSLSWNKKNIQIFDGGLTKDAAEEIFFKNSDLELYGEVYYPNEDGKPVGRFVWSPKDRSIMINVADGKLLGYDGREKLLPIEYSDIENSNYKKAIESLKDLGYGFRTGKFEPEKKMTQVDFLYLVMSNSLDFATVKGNEDKIINEAINRKFITKEEVNKTAIIKPRDFATYFVRNLNLENLAKKNEIFAKPYKDGKSVQDEDLGYVNLAYAFGVLTKDKDGNINAYKELTRGEVAEMFLKSLNNR